MQFLLLFVTLRKKVILKFDESTYFATWGAGIYNPKSSHYNLNNNSIRQIIRVSASGEKIRIKISNKFGKTDLEIRKVSIADYISGSEVNVKTMKFFKFNGKYNVIIESGQEIYSDTIFYSLKSLSEIAISIYFGKVPEYLSGHKYSRTFSYFEKGNKIRNQKFSHIKKIPNWYFISALEISSENPKKVVVCFGDSITDGISNTGDTRNNYPDILAKKFNKNKITSEIAVVNEGIRSDKLMEEGILRYEHDVLDIKGVKYIIILFGVNDINVLNASSSQIINTYRKLIKKAHERNIFIYAGTILPFARYKFKYFWNKKKEKVRKKVNKWIRTTKSEEGGFDYFFDFDKLLKDPKNETILKNIYDCSDGIHPSLEGYKKIVEGINDMTLFTKEPNFKNF